MEAGAPYLAEDGREHKGSWKELFASEAPLYLEIGSGKGRFIAGLAEKHPECSFIACEGGYHIYPRILQKAAAQELSNLRVLPEYIYDPCDFFEDGELDGIYLNFSDPWPKDKHGGRRLTYRAKLEAYGRIIKKGGFIAFKTDNDMLFDFTLGELEAVGMEPERLTRDLHASEWAEENIMTEYEEKFSQTGKSINYLRVIV